MQDEIKMQDELKFLYEQLSSYHKYILDWRYKIFAGFIVLTSILGNYILESSKYCFEYVIACISGLIITVIFFFANRHINRNIWKSQNKAYLIEKKMKSYQEGSSNLGLYGQMINKEIKKELDEGKEPNQNQPFIHCNLNHSGLLDWSFIIVIIFYIVLLCWGLSHNSPLTPPPSSAGLSSMRSDSSQSKPDSSRVLLDTIPADPKDSY